MSDSHNKPPEAELLSDHEALTWINDVVRSWDFETATEAQNAHFTTHLAHWCLEVFGQENSKGEYWLYSGFSYGEGFPYEELPSEIRPLVVSEGYGELYPGNNNGVTMRSAPEIIEIDPYVPKWEELEHLPFREMLAAARSDPEIMAMIQPSQFEIAPAVNLQFTPATYFKWGLQYVIRTTGIEIIPYGEYGSTAAPYKYAVEAAKHKVEVAKSACELVLLAARHGVRHLRNVIDPTMLLVFSARIRGEMNIPIDKISCEPKPTNSIKNFLIGFLISGAEY